RVFHGWPENPPPLNPRPAADIVHNGLRLRAFDFTSEEEVELRLWLLTAAKIEKPGLVMLTAADEPAWEEWTRDLGPAFEKALLADGPPRLDEAKFEQNRRTLEYYKWAFALVAPRGIGPTRWADAQIIDKATVPKQVRRRFALVGQTLDGQRVWDVRRALAVLRGVPDVKGTSLALQGKSDMAGIAVYSALVEP